MIFSEFQQLGNDFAKYIFLLCICYSNPMLMTINKFSQEGCSILNINMFSLLCSTRHFANYFVLNISHKYGITN